METYEQADSGYPEEAPPEVVPDDADPDAAESPRPDEQADDAPDTDDGTATGGNP